MNCVLGVSNHTRNQSIECYLYLLNLKAPYSILELTLIISTIIFNLIVIKLIRKNSTKLTIFDKILLFHCVVDFSVGLIDIPIYHIYNTFGYTPFNSLIGKLWASFDNSINTITNLNMLYLNWSRLRSIQKPTKYKKELLLKYPFRIIVLMWLVSFFIWTPIVFILDLKENTLSINYNSNEIEFLFEFLFWFLPLTLILAISIKIFFHLKKKYNLGNQTHKHVTTGKNKSIFEHIFKYHLGSQTMFTIIMLIYWIQWIIPCIINLLRTIINLPLDLESKLYWLTYSVCLTDPITLLIFNPNVSFLK